jgi:hypothetical protein
MNRTKDLRPRWQSLRSGLECSQRPKAVQRSVRLLQLRRAGDCKDGNDSEPKVTDKLGSIARMRGGTALELYARCVRDLVKANVHGPSLETGFTISMVA